MARAGAGDLRRPASAGADRAVARTGGGRVRVQPAGMGGSDARRPVGGAEDPAVRFAHEAERDPADGRRGEAAGPAGEVREGPPRPCFTTCRCPWDDGTTGGYRSAPPW